MKCFNRKSIVLSDLMEISIIKISQKVNLCVHNGSINRVVDREEMIQKHVMLDDTIKEHTLSSKFTFIQVYLLL